MKHRGRIQAQGKKLEESESWAQDDPLTKDKGLLMLENLKNKLPKKEVEIRKKSFKKAERFIKNGPYQVIDNKISRSYLVADTEQERVDIEVQKGTAFTGE